MKDLYQLNEYCMKFTNEMLERNFFDRVRNLSNVELNYSYCDDERSELFYQTIKDICSITGFSSDYLNKIHRIDCVSFDGKKDNFDIHFHDSGMVSMFLYDKQFLFIDDICKSDVHDTYGCIVYEGYLRDKTHEQILQIFFELFQILYGAKEIEYEEYLISKIGFYNKYNYTVKLNKPNFGKERIQFENILFLIN